MTRKNVASKEEEYCGVTLEFLLFHDRPERPGIHNQPSRIVLASRGGRVRALVDRTVRRLGPVADLRER